LRCQRPRYRRDTATWPGAIPAPDKVEIVAPNTTGATRTGTTMSIKNPKNAGGIATLLASAMLIMTPIDARSASPAPDWFKPPWPCVAVRTQLNPAWTGFCPATHQLVPDGAPTIEVMADSPADNAAVPCGYWCFDTEPSPDVVDNSVPGHH
jgi:hypothetical protein